MYKKFVYPAILLLHFVSYSQELKNKFGEVYYTPDFYKTEYQEAEGTPYLDEQFKPARINDIKETQLVRFDAVKDQVELMAGGNSVMILDEAEPCVISMLDGSEFRYRTKSYFDGNGVVKKSFFRLIYDGDDFELYLKESKKFYKEVKPQAYQEGSPAQFRMESVVFYVNDFRGDKTVLIELPDRLNKFVDLFPDVSREMKEFIKGQRLDLDQGQDLVAIFHHYYEKLHTGG